MLQKLNSYGIAETVLKEKPFELFLRPVLKQVMQLPDAFYFTDQNRTHSAIETIADLPPNVGVIFRHYDTKNRAEIGEKIAHICQKDQRFLSVASDARLACHLKADALHLPQWQLRQLPLLKHRYPNLLISAACHQYLGLKTADRLGADFAFLSPIYPTKSHPGAATLGTIRPTRWLNTLSIPVYALGGIGQKHFNQLAFSGFAGFAGISLFERDLP
ncbi:thiamine phosphate synthase [Sneathiella glossodoripedis]|uniref:thiamine phosphate synthase n=1 Tax=Sneathiella glossodoripedis TaxID=418853 RepID=UPI000471CAF9|nr:thiamine phosphate synthase [Sneathiella glossodoripedis]